jgi:hypothetical protein
MTYTVLGRREGNGFGMRCYFHLVETHETIPDDTGIEVPDVETARRIALNTIQEMRQESEHASEDWRGWQLNIVDSEGRILLSLPLDTRLQ